MTNPGYLPYHPQLHPVPWADDIWTVDGPEVCYRLAGVPLPCPTRMTAVGLPGSKLWLHSPVAYSKQLGSVLGNLGEVAAIIAPNTYHHVNADAWSTAFPSAELHASPDLVRRFGREGSWYPLSSLAPASWGGTLTQALIDLGRFKEVVFFHKPSRTLIVTDLMQNFEGDRVLNPFTRLLLKIGGAIGPVGSTSIEIRLTALRRRAALRAAVREMLDWRPTSIILAHGRSYRTDAVAELSRAFAWTGIK